MKKVVSSKSSYTPSYSYAKKKLASSCLVSMFRPIWGARYPYAPSYG